MINSSAKGPFQPSYMPVDWHWTHAYLVRFRGDVHAVASSIVCLPEQDEGERQGGEEEEGQSVGRVT